MKRIISIILVLCMLASSIFALSACKDPDKDDGKGDGSGNVDGGGNDDGGNDGGNDNAPTGDCNTDGHSDSDSDDYCDVCNVYVAVVIDFYVVNDLHGKFCDTNSQIGVDELATYLNNAEKNDDHTILLSTGDTWQGTAESNLTGGKIITEWMNELDFAAMTLGNHDFDWGEQAIRDNLEVAEFPFLAINVYDKATGKRADYCTPSIMVECDGIQIGIIGAIGDCYSSISYDKVSGLEFKVGNELAALVEAESDRLRAEGADFIVFSLHDGNGNSSSGTGYIGNSSLKNYYTPALSNGVVDLVFEAHTHQNYTLIDSYGVYHLQAGGENKGISHVEISVNKVNGESSIRDAEYVRSSSYASLEDDAATEALEDKYSDIIEYSYSNLGSVSRYYDDDVIEDKVAELYLEAGLEKWGDEYDIFLGGGFLRTRSPYNLSSGDTTYAELLSLFPFDNNIVLCSIKGYKLDRQFVSNTSSDYHIYLSDYGNDNQNSISYNETYYVIVDTYTALYAYNELTIIEYLDDSTYARDLLAEAIANGEI